VILGEEKKSGEQINIDELGTVVRPFPSKINIRS